MALRVFAVDDLASVVVAREAQNLCAAAIINRARPEFLKERGCVRRRRSRLACLPFLPPPLPLTHARCFGRAADPHRKCHVVGKLPLTTSNQKDYSVRTGQG